MGVPRNRAERAHKHAYVGHAGDILLSWRASRSHAKTGFIYGGRGVKNGAPVEAKRSFSEKVVFSSRRNAHFRKYGSNMAQDGLKKAPRGAQEGPRGLEDGPKMSQETPKMAQDSPKITQDAKMSVSPRQERQFC